MTRLQVFIDRSSVEIFVNDGVRCSPRAATRRRSPRLPTCWPGRPWSCTTSMCAVGGQAATVRPAPMAFH
ncbi:GH32 C-terminal domain-containing protein [Ralstonia solanacearum]|uniref:GH32 C-terminal domain-containing protein n=1 Tax=Ralstonia solanacearum TaxID=305 RepID=UPI003AF326AB